MNQVTVQANPGQLIILDQCGQCGGIWCDKWELFPVDADTAESIDPLNKALLTDPTKLTQKPIYCPRCTAELHFFAEPILPKEIQLLRCHRCDGIWLNRGRFRRYKEYQKTNAQQKIGPPGADQKNTECLPESEILDCHRHPRHLCLSARRAAAGGRG